MVVLGLGYLGVLNSSITLLSQAVVVVDLTVVAVVEPVDTVALYLVRFLAVGSPTQKTRYL